MSREDTFLPYGLLCTERFLAISDKRNGAVALSDYEGNILTRFEGLASPTTMTFFDDKLYVVTQAGIEQIDTTANECCGMVVSVPLIDALTVIGDKLAAAYDGRVVYYNMDDFSVYASVQTCAGTVAMTALCEQLWCVDGETKSLHCIENGMVRAMHDFALDAPKAIAAGKYGDGCGGGRLFMVDGNSVKVYNPDDGSKMTLMENLPCPSAIDKKGCSLYVADNDGIIRFNLSEMKSMKFL